MPGNPQAAELRGGAEARALRCATGDGGAAEVDAIREHIARHRGADYPLDLLDEEAGEHEVYDQHDELGAWQEEGDAGDLLNELVDEALHRGSCYPWTATRVPLLAGLAVDERLTDHHRSVLLLDLYAIATAGRTQRAAATPHAVEARAAVARELPRIVARRGDAELYAFLGAALAAACPEADAWPVADLQTLALRWKGTTRGPAAALILALATSDAAAVEAALTEAAPDALAGPRADPADRAVAVLKGLIESELDRSQPALP